QFETDITRTLRVIEYEGTGIEVALDIGAIRTLDTEQEVHEVEFELKSGCSPASASGRHSLGTNLKSSR
ncbi:hypothetical protein EKL28_15890, partial [Staphylococcus aureus]